MLRCKDIAKLLSDSLEKELPWTQRVEIRLHLMICYVCRRYWKQLRFLHNCITNYYDKKLDKDPALSQESKKRMQDKIIEEMNK
ncbi:zf-HC2 domain-containing protein [Candidatus Uabimicrobium amorphum]|uniref:Putative zinc-finger domain-containing protein n=1 Tax=Uabimicrobium amorphum TaxID=2596890 RepID=A0A5S9IS61_UABAM|nr:zf-HC2 domain-containing protein [Candidatus Uabimicrobium amorphum]BBM85695.1 hypothetical protein UABAM_04070 [Candidatus Uabimicrobium amorphum]